MFSENFQKIKQNIDKLEIVYMSFDKILISPLFSAILIIPSQKAIIPIKEKAILTARLHPSSMAVTTLFNVPLQAPATIDIEIRKIVDGCYKNATKILKENMELVKLIANALLERETLTKEQIEYLVENKELPDETSLNDLTVDELREKAKEAGIKGTSKMTKEELIKELNK